MRLDSRVRKLEKMQRDEELVIVTYLPDFNDPDYIIVSRTDRDEVERITREECQQRLAEARANGHQVIGIPPRDKDQEDEP